MPIHVNKAALKECRLKNYWSQEELAVVTGLSVRTIQRAEATGEISRETAKSLASVFETTIEELELEMHTSTLKRSYLPGVISGIFFALLGTAIGIFAAADYSFPKILAFIAADPIGPILGLSGILLGSTCAIFGAWLGQRRGHTL